MEAKKVQYNTLETRAVLVPKLNCQRVLGNNTTNKRIHTQSCMLPVGYRTNARPLLTRATRASIAS